MPILKLTQDALAALLVCPSGRTRFEFCDTEVRGLYIEARATAPGQGTYYLRYKDGGGKTCHQKIARTTEITLTDARKKARTLKAEIQLGADPRGEVKAQRAVITLDDFFISHYLPYAKPRKRSWERDEELYRLRIKAVFGDRRLNEITRQQIQTLHTSILESGLSPATADHHVKLIRQALNKAIEWDLLTVNPAAKVPLFNVDNKVEHYLNGEELERLLKVLRTDANRTVCNIAMFLLSTGCRLNEALQATWQQFDRESRVWRIPASNSKSKRVRSVPLNDSALEVLKALDTEGEFEHLFINRRTKKPLGTIMKVWSRLRKQAGLEHLRIHDLRHMYASFLVNSGRTLYEVQQILGHSDPSVTQRYAHLSSKSLQDAANCASKAILDADTAIRPLKGLIPVSNHDEPALAADRLKPKNELQSI
jgi:integrase